MELKQQLEDLKSAQAGLTAHAGRWDGHHRGEPGGLASSVVAGFVGLVVGIFIGVAVAPPRR